MRGNCFLSVPELVRDGARFKSRSDGLQWVSPLRTGGSMPMTIVLFGGTVPSERAQSYFCGFLTSLSLGIEAPRLPVTYLMAQLPIA